MSDHAARAFSGLRRLIRHGSYAALDQRIAVRYHLHPLQLSQMGGYIRHHPAIAGRFNALFADDAIQAIAHAARGLPRQIGNVAVAALIAGYARRNTIIDMDHVTATIADLTSTGITHRSLSATRESEPVKSSYGERLGDPRMRIRVIGVSCGVED